MAETEKTVKEDFSGSDQMIYLTVAVNKPGWGKSKVWMDDVELYFDENLSHVRVGSGTANKGKTLYVKTPVVDFDDKTDALSVTYYLEDGKSSGKYPLSMKVASAGHAGIFWAEITIK